MHKKINNILELLFNLVAEVFNATIDQYQNYL